MELREFINLFCKYSRLFWWIVGAVLLAAILLKLFIPTGSLATVEIAVTRTSTQKTDQYTYDDFYRLQADEKFAETVTRWLGIPRVAQRILSDAGFSDQLIAKYSIDNYFRADRLSAQLVLVRFPAESLLQAQKVSKSIEKIIQDKIEELNRDQKNNNWFVVQIDSPTLKDLALSWIKVLIIGFGSGLFIAFWAVLLKHYFWIDYNRDQ